MSLLGTFHGREASEKWDPKKSSLYQVCVCYNNVFKGDLWLNAFLLLYQQVLLSIQGMMFTPDPCFNEPGYEGIKGTDEGDVSSILCKPSQGSILYHTLLTTNGNSECVASHRYSKDVLTGIVSRGSSYPLHSPVSCRKLVY